MTGFAEQMGAWMASERERHGVSQEWLGQQIGLDQAALSRIEAGHRGLSFEEFLRWVLALGIPEEDIAPAVVEFLGWMGEQGSIWERERD